MRRHVVFVLFPLAVSRLAGCTGGGEEALPEAQEKRDVLSGEEQSAGKAADGAAGARSDADAGVDGGPEGQGFSLTAESSEREFEALVSHLNDRQAALDLKEREIIQREQMVSSLEESVLKQTERLWQLKTQVSELLEKMGDGYKEERQAREEKQRKEEARRAKEREALQRAAEEIAEEREQRIGHLTATIKGMRASSGAGMLASMDEGDAVAVLRQLGARQAAGLLGNMPAEKAAQLAEAMLGPKAPSLGVLDNPGNQAVKTEEGTPAK